MRTFGWSSLSRPLQAWSRDADLLLSRSLSAPGDRARRDRYLPERRMRDSERSAGSERGQTCRSLRMTGQWRGLDRLDHPGCRGLGKTHPPARPGLPKTAAPPGQPGSRQARPPEDGLDRPRTALPRGDEDLGDRVEAGAVVVPVDDAGLPTQGQPVG